MLSLSINSFMHAGIWNAGADVSVVVPVVGFRELKNIVEEHDYKIWESKF